MKITIIGAGEMGRAFAEGLLAAAVIDPADITVSNPHENKLKALARQGVSVTTDNRVAVQGADFVVLAVRPDVVRGVAEEIKGVLDVASQAVLNMAATVTLSQLTSWLATPDGTPHVLQVLPNVAISVRQSVTFIVPDAAATGETGRVRKLFDSLGTTFVITESQLPAATALSGCAIAYAMRYVRAASEAGVELGFPASDARDITLQTLRGATELLEASGRHPEEAIDSVTTPGGLTIRGLNALEAHGFSAAVIQGILAGRA